MANKTIKVSNLEQGEFLSWFVTTQAAFKIHIKLYDDKKIYFDETRQSTDINPPMSQGSADYVGKDLYLYIEIPEAQDINTFLNTFALLTPAGVCVGHGFTCCGEDSKDNDFNDFYINIMGWKSKG